VLTYNLSLFVGILLRSETKHRDILVWVCVCV
jgi:hypothetical protein